MGTTIVFNSVHDKWKWFPVMSYNFKKKKDNFIGSIELKPIMHQLKLHQSHLLNFSRSLHNTVPYI